MSVAEARKLAVELAEATVSERVSTAQAHGRVLRSPVAAKSDFPRFDNSAMDGWAVAEARPGGFRVVGESRAGEPFNGSLGTDEAVRISTGAALPPGAAAVVPIEHGTEQDARLMVDKPALVGEHVRSAGRHAQAGSEVVPVGIKLGAGELAAMLALGVETVSVAAAPKVALVVSGDELVDPGDPAPLGAVFDSNSPMLSALIVAAGCALVDVRFVPDDLDAMTEALDQARSEADLVITSGGVSVGDHDHVSRAIIELGGDLLVAGTTARPGRRMAIARLGGEVRARPVFCLPGNPLSTWVGYQLYVRRHIRAMLGQAMPPIFEAELRGQVPRSAKSTRIVLGRIATESGSRSFWPRDTRSDNTLALVSTNALATIESGDSVAQNGIFVECEKVDV